MSRTRRILFFADGGAAVGGGHVMRCLTLAEALRRRGAVCAFAAIPAATAILDVFADDDIVRLPLPDAPPARIAPSIDEIARRWGAQALVVDHFGFGLAEEGVVRVEARPLIVLDDLKRAHRCDLVLDSGLNRDASNYPGAESLIGPGFALVRPQFAAGRADALSRRGGAGPVRRVQVALGLTDVGAVTGRVIETILPLLGKAHLDVVVGRSAASLPRLIALAARDGRLALHIDSRDMAALTAAADLAIGAGGSSVWERCCLGLATITLVLADNQRDGAGALAARGAALSLEAADADFLARLPAAFEQMMTDPIRIARMSMAAAEICDGLGADRVAERLLSML